MPFLPRALYLELLALQRDVREGRLVRVAERNGDGTPPVTSVAADQHSERASVPTATPLPPELLAACEHYASDRHEFTANAAMARKLLAEGKKPREIHDVIAKGAPLDHLFL